MSADNCSAVGTYYDDTPSGPGYNTEPLLLTETGGVWTASQAVLPPNATSAPLAGAFVVSCAAADDCSAIGAYHDASNNEHGLLLGGSGAPLTLGVTLAGAGQGQVTGSGIACPGTCSGQYPAGTTVTLTATSASGSTFTGWSGGGCSGTGPCAVTLNEDEAVTATFVVGTRYSLKLSKSGSGTGTVTSSPAGIRCGASCSAHFVPGTQVTLIPTPASGSDFVGWSGCPGTSNAKTSAEKPKAGGPPSACRITMNSSHALVANFVSKTQVASATKGLKGDLAALHQALTSPSAVGTAECKGKVSYNAGAKQAEQYQASPITVTAPPGTMPVANEGSTYATTSRPIVVFTGARHRFLHSGTATITQRLTRQGRQLLKQAARQHRTLTLSFRMSSIFADPVQVDTGGQIKVQPPAQPHC